MTLFTFHTPSYSDLAAITLETMNGYCNKHEYQFISAVHDSENVGLDKCLHLYELLQTHETIFVLDCDAAITNDNYKLESFIDEHHDVFACEDVHGFNAGSFIIRKTENSIAFLRAVIENYDAPEEQTMFKQYLHLVAVKYLPHPSINSYMYNEYLNEWTQKVGFGLHMPKHNEGNWQRGDFILHLPGLSNERRVEVFKAVLL
jgi:hypothetical protein